MNVRLLIQTPSMSYRWESSANVCQLGRSMDCDLSFAGKDCIGVSGHHAKLEFSSQGLTVWDLSSKNGTFVNGQRIKAPHPVHVGDVISLGRQGPKLKVLQIDHPSVHQRGAKPIDESGTINENQPSVASLDPSNDVSIRPMPLSEGPPSQRVAAQLRPPIMRPAPPPVQSPTRIMLARLMSTHKRYWIVMAGLGLLLVVAVGVILAIVIANSNVSTPGNGPSQARIYENALRHSCAIGFRKDIGTDRAFNGSGSIIHLNKRLILTNYHVIWPQTGKNAEVLVYFPKYRPNGATITSRQQYLQNKWYVPGKIKGFSMKLDLAVIQVDRLPNHATAVELTAIGPKVTDKIHLVGGNPIGSGNAMWIYGTGVVRSVEQHKFVYKNPPVQTVEAMFIQSDVPSNGGDSGAGVLNDQGFLVGVNHGSQRGAGNKVHIEVRDVRKYLLDNNFLD